jgi:hypothetical protein
MPLEPTLEMGGAAAVALVDHMNWHMNWPTL